MKKNKVDKGIKINSMVKKVVGKENNHDKLS